MTSSTTTPLDANAAPAPAAGYGRTIRIGILVATAVAVLVVAFARSRLPQSIDYFDFADGRRLAGIPNALNVLSNLAFLATGGAGIAAIRAGRVRFRDARERAPWLVLFTGVALTGVGSTWFHLAPSSATLVWDRLPMTLGFMGLLSGIVAERVDAAWGRRLLWPLVVAGIASVLYWYGTELAGVGDLRPYFLVQYYPLLAIPLILLLFPARYSGSLAYLAALGAYLLAKVAEVEDAGLYGLGRVVSGHTVKHLLAAAGIAALLWMLVRREPLEARGEGSTSPRS
jgi:hypothetical protein